MHGRTDASSVPNAKRRFERLCSAVEPTFRPSHRFVGARMIASRTVLIGIAALIAGLTISAPAWASPVQGLSNPVGGLSTAANSTNPLIVPGTYVLLSCLHGTISLNGGQYCDDGSWEGDLCDSSSCSFALKGTVDSGYTFYGWVVTGEASVACGSCLSTTLTVYTPNTGDHYTATVELDTTPPPPPPTVKISVVTFVNGTSGWNAGEVQACLEGSCSTAGNGGTLTLDQDVEYNISAVDTPTHVQFEEWAASVGVLSNNSTNPTEYWSSSSGTLAMIASFAPVSWVGYADSSCAPSCRAVSAEFQVPPSGGTSGVAMWVGIGGMHTTGAAYTNLWQAGVQFNASGTNYTSIHPFWEACGPGIGSCTSAGSGAPHYNYSFGINPLDWIAVDVYNHSGELVIGIQDLTEPYHPLWNLSVSSSYATPPTSYVEWVVEPNHAGSFSLITFKDLELGWAQPHFYDGCLALWSYGADQAWYVTPPEGSTYFSQFVASSA